jgi:hypothetical protein
MTDLPFNLFRFGPFHGVDIYAVTTVSKQDNSTDPVADWFYYSVNSKHLNGQKTSLELSEKEFKSLSALSPEAFDGIDAFLHNDAKRRLREAIWHEEVVPVLEKLKDYSLCTGVNLVELTPDTLIYLSVDHMTFINYLKQHTSCEKLKQLVNALPLIKIDRKDI